MKKELKKVLALLLVVAMVFAMAACGGGTGNNGGDNGASGNSIAVCIASEPDSIDPALNSSVDGATMLCHLFAGLSKWQKNESGGFDIVADCATELVEPVTNENGTVTYTYTLKDGLKWSDGKDLTANDFVYSWNRAASPALAGDYCYMFEVVDGYEKMWESEPSGEKDEEGNDIPKFINPDAKLNVVAKDEKTIEITLAAPIAYWNELLAFPTYFPVREDVVADEKWATNPATYVCNGPYKMAGWEHDSVITLEKNPDFYNAENVTMDKIEFFLSNDSNNMYANFKQGTWLMIDDVPTNEMESAKQQYPDEYFVDGQIGTYYVCWNVNEKLLPEGNTLEGVEAEKAEAEIRSAMGLLLDRNYIVNDIAQGGQIPASSFVAMGMTEPNGSEFYENAGDKAKNGYIGFYDVSKDAVMNNYNKALEILKKYYTFDEASGKFTNVPTLRYLYNTSEAHKAIAEYIQQAVGNIGITMSLENQEWNTFLQTRKNGDYSVARNGWVADYNDPICFLDMWTTNSGNNDIQFGRGDHSALKMYNLDLTDIGFDTKVENGTWAETYDVLIGLIKKTKDNEKRFALMHKAENLLMSTGAVTPLYYYTDTYMLSKKVKGFFSIPLGYKFFTYATIEE